MEPLWFLPAEDPARRLFGSEAFFLCAPSSPPEAASTPHWAAGIRTSLVPPADMPGLLLLARQTFFSSVLFKRWQEALDNLHQQLAQI